MNQRTLEVYDALTIEPQAERFWREAAKATWTAAATICSDKRAALPRELVNREEDEAYQQALVHFVGHKGLSTTR